ncbi:aminodeoxychorismate lyase [Corynebacterium variabile]|uniref:Branched-chain amino acid aminotransferase/4-amino-4-deoxychorismate lyase n=1 Tax=Corynebacterium variabile TaxID=1727 RepID=A0A0X2NNL3_9CORY|nr:aminodeoxychorismate lyase [Corynebacterium variabile]CUU67097.1 Branched-chain amino acid aminotransferase/4-amino-4-deoxychorismate lyase [Corynebacterium variabile]
MDVPTTTSSPLGSRAVVAVHPSGDAAPELLDPTLPALYIDDLAAVRGDGVFETLMVRDGAVRNLDRHTARFINSAAMLDLPAPDTGRWHAATDLALEHWVASGGGDGSLRWMYSRGRETTREPTGWVTVAPEPPAVARGREQGVRVMTAQRGYSLDITKDAAPWALVGAKTLSYAANMAALRYAKSHDLDDVIFIGDGERVLEGPTSTVIMARDRDGVREILTPLHEVGVLPGTTQAAMYRLAGEAGWTCSEAPLTVGDLRNADGVWLLSSVRRYARVTALDGTPLDRPVCADEIEDLATRAAEGR